MSTSLNIPAAAAIAIGSAAPDAFGASATSVYTGRAVPVDIAIPSDAVAIPSAAEADMAGISPPMDIAGISAPIDIEGISSWRA
jgi:hypothetical protein